MEDKINELEILVTQYRLICDTPCSSVPYIYDVTMCRCVHVMNSMSEDIGDHRCVRFYVSSVYEYLYICCFHIKRRVPA
jgi:hypothetical protein